MVDGGNGRTSVYAREFVDREYLVQPGKVSVVVLSKIALQLHGRHMRLAQ